MKNTVNVTIEEVLSTYADIINNCVDFAHGFYVKVPVEDIEQQALLHMCELHNKGFFCGNVKVDRLTKSFAGNLSTYCKGEYNYQIAHILTNPKEIAKLCSKDAEDSMPEMLRDSELRYDLCSAIDKIFPTKSIQMFREFIIDQLSPADIAHKHGISYGGAHNGIIKGAKRTMNSFHGSAVINAYKG